MKHNPQPIPGDVMPAAVSAGPPEDSDPAGQPEGFRSLKFNELVKPGDFVQDEQLELKLWEGPPGFRADSFLKKIYRRVNETVDSPSPAQKPEMKLGGN